MSVCNSTTGRIGVTGARVLLAVIDLSHAGPVTVYGIAQHLGLARASVWAHLQTLRAAGLVTWTPGCYSTIRPAVEVVPV